MIDARGGGANGGEVSSITMNAASTTRPRHALRWVLGVGLVFVVVVGMALHVVRRRADERWESVLTRWDKAWPSSGNRGFWMNPSEGRSRYSRVFDLTELLDASQQGGNILRGNRRVLYLMEGGVTLDLGQERSHFSSRIDARLSRAKPDQVEAARAILASFDIELVVEP